MTNNGFSGNSLTKPERADVRNAKMVQKKNDVCIINNVRWKLVVAGLEIGSNVQTARTLCQS